MRELWLYLFVGTSLLVIGAAVGSTWETRRAAQELVGINGDLASCRGAAESKDTAIARLTRQNNERLDELRARADVMKVALADRDAQARADTAATLRRYTHTAQVPHEKVDCQALAVLPVCPAVAERLWGRNAAHETTDVSTGDTDPSY